MTVIDLSGRVAIVTGASRGIGRAAAESLLKAGCSVVLNARPSNEASASFAEMEAAYPDRVTIVYGSVADSATATALAHSAMSRHKRLDILVNNAGILRDKLIGMISDAEIEELFDMNVIGLIKVTQLAARVMGRRKSGSIVNVSSIVGRRGSRGQPWPRREDRLRAKAARLSLLRRQFRNGDRPARCGHGRLRDRADRSVAPRRDAEGPD